MRPAIHPRLVNPGPFEDPGLFINFTFAKRALLFDLGDLHRLSPRDLLKVTHVFVTHTHIDHFIGFDHLLRICLGRNKIIRLFGPPGLFANTAGKLAGYTWNLLHNYENSFGFIVTEVHPDHLATGSLLTTNHFSFPAPLETTPFSGTLLDEPEFSVKAVILDHGVPCLGLALEERFHVNIMKARLEEMGLAVGPWLRSFKQSLLAGEDKRTRVEALAADGGVAVHELGALADQIAHISQGQKIAYVTDAAGHAANQEKILSLARGADQLFIEASFANEDQDLADARQHLTAGMAGDLAKRAGARQLHLFHFSPRYQDNPEILITQARMAFDAE